MPSVVQTQTLNNASIGFLLKDRPADPLATGFTAVNSRATPTSPPRLNPIHGMAPGPYPHHSTATPQDQKPLPSSEHWQPVPTAPQSNHSSTSPILIDGDRSSHSPIKRKRSVSGEDDRSTSSPIPSPDQTRRRVGSYPSPETSPPMTTSATMDQQQRTLPPISQAVAAHDKKWSMADVEPPTPVQYRDPQDPHSAPHYQGPGPVAVDPSQQTSQVSSTTEITRAGVQVDPKKRKRQFANRTKTGCGTCRKRKKKCDEAKPECNNCLRGGFMCTGYSPRRPWGAQTEAKNRPPLQPSKERYSVEQQPQNFHHHGTKREAYPDPSVTDGARGRPIVVDEHERPPQRAEWRNWNEPLPQPHQRPHHPEHSQAQDHPHPVCTAPHMPPPILAHDRYAQPTPAPAPPTSSHPPRVYNHSPSSMSHVLNHSPSGTVEPPPRHHQPSHSSLPSAQHTPSSSVQPVPPPPFYPPQPARRERSEKDKMLAGEEFLPFHPSLIAERDYCSDVVFRFNSTSKDGVQITHKERSRSFRNIVESTVDMDLRYRGSSSNSASSAPYAAGHVGQDVHVNTPFHCDYGYNLVIGDSVTIGPGCKFLDSGRITVGRAARIGASVIIDTQKVPTDPKSRKGSQGTCVAREVVIGENVYIGAGAVICAGVKIGVGAVVHPGAVVMNDVPPHSFVRPNPPAVSMVNWDH